MIPAEYCYTVHVKVTHMSVLLYYLLTYSMEQSPSWEAKTF
jgi:hypothetical protein